MILGVGTDLVEVLRMERCIQKEAFCRRVFTEAERAYAQSRHGTPEAFAGMFAAKEAVSKALGTGFSGFTLRDIEVLHTSAGAPLVRLTGGAETCFLNMNGTRIHLSISHDGGLAVAFAVAEG